MSLLEALNRHERPPLHCRIYQTYLPLKYLPDTCSRYFAAEDGLYYYPQWAWSLINTAVVSTATIFNTTVFMLGVFLWMANRQFHFSKKKHSYDKEPLRPLKPLRKAKKSSIRVLKKAKRNIINKVRKSRGVTIIEDVSEREEEVKFEKIPGKGIRRDRSFSSFLQDVEKDEGDL